MCIGATHFIPFDCLTWAKRVTRRWPTSVSIVNPGLGVTEGLAGAQNDKTIVRFDSFVDSTLCTSCGLTKNLLYLVILAEYDIHAREEHIALPFRFTTQTGLLFPTKCGLVATVCIIFLPIECGCDDAALRHRVQGFAVLRRYPFNSSYFLTYSPITQSRVTQETAKDTKLLYVEAKEQ